jgi:HTH-type transcriptional regulator/antitoxin HipB
MQIIRNMDAMGAAIKKRRKEMGYTQAFLAAYAGVSASFLSDLENGKETIQMNKMLLILQLLGMDLFVDERG